MEEDSRSAHCASIYLLREESSENWHKRQCGKLKKTHSVLRLHGTTSTAYCVKKYTANEFRNVSFLY